MGLAAETHTDTCLQSKHIITAMYGSLANTKMFFKRKSQWCPVFGCILYRSIQKIGWLTISINFFGGERGLSQEPHDIGGFSTLVDYRKLIPMNPGRLDTIVDSKSSKAFSKSRISEQHHPYIVSQISDRQFPG